VDVAAWLRSLDLERYAQVFQENAVDGEVLLELTAEDLRELGVVAVGHRRKLLSAIQTLRLEPIARSGDTANVTANSQSTSVGLGERRQIAVFFADLSGFTALSQVLDAEELHATLQHYFEVADRIIVRHGGHIDKHIGDSVMAVFGAPISHGDDVERAMKAALAIRDAASTIKIASETALSVHIGVASGQVVASSTGSENHYEYTVTGKTVNLAARLSSVAAAGDVLISDAARFALADRVVCEALGALSVKGFDTPVVAWRLLGFDTALSSRPFVGRDRELALLRTLLDVCVNSGRGQVIYLRGEAGIGKSRLAEELQKAGREMGFVCHVGRAVDFGVRTGRDALRSLVRDIFELNETSSEEAIRGAISSFLSSGLIDRDQRLFVEDLLDVSLDPEEHAIFEAMDNSARAIGRRDVVAKLVERASRSAPRLLLVEDIHWTDSTSLNDLARLASVVADCAALLLLTSRLEGDPLDAAWKAGAAPASLTTLDLGPLASADARRLIEPLKNGAEGFIERCLERAAGNPLFLDQLLRHSSDNSDAAVPASVQSLVQARLDQLEPSDKEAALAASVLGQVVDAEALEHLVDDKTAIRRLTDRFLLRPQAQNHIFHHALIRDAIYDGLLKARRRELHRRAADWYARRDAGLAAEHLDRAEDPRAPLAYLEAARAQAKAYRYEAALRLVDRGRHVAVDVEHRFALQDLFADILHDVGDMSAALAAYGSAYKTATSDALRCKALIGLAKVKRIIDDLDGAWTDLDTAEPLAKSAGLLADQAHIHFLRGNLCFPRGDAEGCVSEHSRSLALAREAGEIEREAAALGGIGEGEYMRGRMLSAFAAYDRCISVCEAHGLLRIEAANRPMRSIGAYFSGDMQAALRDALASVAVASKIGHLRAEMIAHHSAFHYFYAVTDLDKAWEHTEAALNLARRLGAPRFEAEGLAFRAELQRAANRRKEALNDIHTALAMSRETGMAYLGPYYLGLLARTTDDQNEYVEALREGRAILAAGAVSHNHYLFHRDAIDACLDWRAFELAEEHAAELETYAERQPGPWTRFYVDRGRYLAAFGRGEAGALDGLRRLKEIGQRYSFLEAIRMIDVALNS